MKFAIYLMLLLSYLVYSQDFRLIGPPGGRVLKLKAHPTIHNKIFAGNYGGGLFFSSNGGLNNNFFDLNFGSSNIMEINLVNEDIYIQIRNYLLRSHNAGLDWHIDSWSSVLKKRILINPFNPSTVYITNGEKEVWKSYDKGGNWFLLKSFNSGLRGIALAKTDTSVLYAGADLTIYKSTNAGEDWIRTLDSSVSISIYQLEINPLNENSIYFYDSFNRLYKSEDGGSNIRQIMSNHSSIGFAIHPIDTSIIYSYSPIGGIVKSTDDGVSWQIVNNGLPQNSYPHSLEIDPINPETLYAGIGDLGVFKSSNGGANWVLNNLSNNSIIYTILLHQSGRLEVGVYGWGIMKTINNGTDWLQPDFASGNYQNMQCRAITYHPYDSSKGYLATGLTLYKSTDNGESWYSTNQLPGINSVSYNPHHPDIVFAASYEAPTSGNSYIHRSTDGGITWSDFDLGWHGNRIHKFHFDPVNFFVYAVGPLKILKSTDMGSTWNTKLNGINESTAITDFAINSSESNILYCTQRAIGTSKGYFYKSTDGGEEWFRIDSVLHTLDPAVSISNILLDRVNPERIYLGLLTHGQPLTPMYSNGGLYLSPDDGLTWRKVYGGEVSLIKADENNPRNVHLASKFGLMTFLDTLTVTSVKDEKDLISVTDYKLHQNYPNPFNPITVIGYQLPVSVNVTLKVFDMLGREVAMLVNEYKEAGTHSVEFNAAGLPSGVYFYRINAGSFSETKKMILLR